MRAMLSNTSNVRLWRSCHVCSLVVAVLYCWATTTLGLDATRRPRGRGRSLYCGLSFIFPNRQSRENGVRSLLDDLEHILLWQWIIVSIQVLLRKNFIQTTQHLYRLAAKIITWRTIRDPEFKSDQRIDSTSKYPQRTLWTQQHSGSRFCVELSDIINFRMTKPWCSESNMPA